MCVCGRARTGTCVCSTVHLCGRSWLGQRRGVQGAKGERAPSRGSALAVSTGSCSCSSCRAYSSRHLCRSACPRGQRRMPYRQARVGAYHHRHPGDRSAQQCTAHHHSTMYGRTRSPSQPGAHAQWRVRAGLCSCASRAAALTAAVHRLSASAESVHAASWRAGSAALACLVECRNHRAGRRDLARVERRKHLLYGDTAGRCTWR